MENQGGVQIEKVDVAIQVHQLVIQPSWKQGIERLQAIVVRVVIATGDICLQRYPRLRTKRAKRVSSLRFDRPRLDAARTEPPPLVNSLEILVPGAALAPQSGPGRMTLLATDSLLEPGSLSIKPEIVKDRDLNLGCRQAAHLHRVPKRSDLTLDNHRRSRGWSAPVWLPED